MSSTSFINDDLDRFIMGEIGFHEIQGRTDHDCSIYWSIISIISARKEASYYSKDEHDFYEKLCYADVLRTIQEPSLRLSPHNVYAKYLAEKDLCSPHKLDWNLLFEKIKKITEMNKFEMDYGESLYKDYQKGGDLFADIDYDSD